MISRRAFVAGSIALLAGPLSARAQSTGKVHRIGLLAASRQAVDNLKEGLAVLGHRRGRALLSSSGTLKATSSSSPPPSTR